MVLSKVASLGVVGWTLGRLDHQAEKALVAYATDPQRILRKVVNSSVCGAPINVRSSVSCSNVHKTTPETRGMVARFVASPRASS